MPDIDEATSMVRLALVQAYKVDAAMRYAGGAGRPHIEVHPATLMDIRAKFDVSYPAVPGYLLGSGQGRQSLAGFDIVPNEQMPQDQIDVVVRVSCR